MTKMTIQHVPENNEWSVIQNNDMMFVGSYAQCIFYIGAIYLNYHYNDATLMASKIKSN